MTFIYALIDPFSNEIRYIGKASCVSKRYNQHINFALRGECRYAVTRWVRELIDSGVKPDIFVLEETNDNDWVESEKFWIKYCRDRGCDLVNSNEGGQAGAKPGTGLGRKFTDEHRRRMSEARKKQSPPTLGMKFSKETCAKISAVHKGKKVENPWWQGKKHSDEAKEKMRIIAKNRKFSEETRRKMSEANNRRYASGYKLEYSDETRKKIGEATKFRLAIYNAWTGKKHSEQAKKRMSEAHKDVWRKKKEQQEGIKQ